MFLEVWLNHIEFGIISQLKFVENALYDFCVSVINLGLTHSLLKSLYPLDKGDQGGLGDLGGLKDGNYHFLRLNVRIFAQFA